MLNLARALPEGRRQPGLGLRLPSTRSPPERPSSCRLRAAPLEAALVSGSPPHLNPVALGERHNPLSLRLSTWGSETTASSPSGGGGTWGGNAGAAQAACVVVGETEAAGAGRHGS